MPNSKRTSMIEKVAKAIAYSGLESSSPHKPNWRNYIPEAKAAMEAMRRPTEKMLKAGVGYGLRLDGMYEGTDAEFIEDIMDSMIDSAFSGSEII